MAYEDGEGFKRVKIVDGTGDKNYIRVKQVDDTSVKNYINVKESTEEKKDYINVQVVDYEYPKNYLRVNFVGGSPIDPLSYDNIAFLGASLMQEAFSDDNRLTLVSPQFTAGTSLDGVDLYVNAVSGSTSNSYPTLASELVTDLSSVTGSVLVFVHGPGNDVSDGRPYDTDTNVTNSIQNMRDTFDILIAAGFDVAYSGVSWRDYDDVPPESNGSLPYNDSAYYPLIQEYCPDWWNSDEGVPYVNMYNYTKSSQGTLLRDGIHPSTSSGEFSTNAFVINSIIQRSDAVTYDYVGKTIVGCWTNSESSAETVSDGINRWVIGLTAAAGSYFKDSAGELPPLHFCSGGSLSHTSGRGSTGITGYNLLNEECTAGGMYTAEDDIYNGYFWLGSSRYAGLTGTVKFTASRAVTGTDRFSEFTVDGTTQSIDASLVTPVSIEFPFTVDADGVIEFTWNKQAGSSFGYFSAWQLDFDDNAYTTEYSEEYK